MTEQLQSKTSGAWLKQCEGEIQELRKSAPLTGDNFELLVPALDAAGVILAPLH